MASEDLINMLTNAKSNAKHALETAKNPESESRF